jgi:nucleotide-binding universal stress UspA family protein
MRPPTTPCSTSRKSGALTCSSSACTKAACGSGVASPTPTGVEMAPGVYVDQDAIEALERRAVADLATEYELAPERVDIVPGTPTEVIALNAEDRRAALVVMGVLRRGQIEQAMIGSTAEGVAMDVSCDILLVPPPKVASDTSEREPRARGKARTAKPHRRGASSAAHGRRPAAP